MEIDKMYIKGVIDTVVEQYEHHNAGHDFKDKETEFTLTDYYGSQNKVIGVKVDIKAICGKIRKPEYIDGEYAGMEEENEYYEQYFIVYGTDKIGSFISDIESELVKIDEFQIQ